MDAASADVKFLGEDADDYLGVHVSAAGDVEGDGAQDLLLSAGRDDDGGTNAGAVHLVSGGGS